MKEFKYVIKDELGIHARPAGVIVKAAAGFQSKITIAKEGKEADAKKILGVMSLAVKQGNEVTVKVEGDDEDTAFEAIKVIFEENL